MSIKVLSYVWERSHQKGSHLLLLLAIADYADDAGFAYPSVPRLARKSRMTDRNVQYALNRLVHSGEIAYQPHAGPNGTHLYQVLMHYVGPTSSWGENFAPANGRKERSYVAGGANLAPGVKSLRGENQCARGVKGLSPNPSGDPSEEKKENHYNLGPGKQTSSSEPAPDAPEEASAALLKRKTPPTPIREEDWPGLRQMLLDFKLPLAPLDDNDWWNSISYTCNSPEPDWLQVEFARMEAWLKENPRKTPTTRWKTFVRGWLERAYEAERKRHAR